MPNKEAYRMTLAENEEIRSQVHEFLNKGLVRESLSPCAIPTVLIPNKGGEWRMCTNSRDMNMITIKYIFSFPMMDHVTPP